MTSTPKRRTSQTGLAARTLLALEALKYEPSDEEIGEGRLDYLAIIEKLGGRDDLQRWTDYACQLDYRDAVVALATGEYDPAYRLKVFRRTYCLTLAAAVADLPSDEWPNLSAADREFAQQARSALQLREKS